MTETLTKPDFGTIEIRPHKTCTTYRAVYRLQGKKQTKTFDTHREALDLLNEIARGLREGRDQAPSLTKPRTPLRTVAEEWFAGRPKDPKKAGTRRTERTYLENHIYPTFGDQAIGAITRRQIQAWISDLYDDLAWGCQDCEALQDEDEYARCQAHKKKPAAASSVHCYYGLFGQIMRWAQLEDYLPNGCPIGKGLHTLPSKESRMVFLDDEELDHLLAVTRKQFPTQYAMVHLTSHTGMRQGEILALRRRAFNPIGAFVDVNLATKQGGKRPTTGSTKTGKHRRISIDSCCVAVLNAHLSGQDSEWIFPSQVGKPQNATNWRRRHWYPIRDAAGFGDLDLHFHDLRHTHCSMLLAAGWDAVAVAQRLGHSSSKMTLDVYGHAYAGRQAQLIRERGMRVNRA